MWTVFPGCHTNLHNQAIWEKYSHFLSLWKLPLIVLDHNKSDWSRKSSFSVTFPAHHMPTIATVTSGVCESYWMPILISSTCPSTGMVALISDRSSQMSQIKGVKPTLADFQIRDRAPRGSLFFQESGGHPQHRPRSWAVEDFMGFLKASLKPR